ncbi:hypothetical protein lbkm_1231 [Lachnospiraceae bacterium KM106-2]|nr:hypothetical protein lbkm_1231 [Lachnospiraceae bacterium KM106-2]
MSEENKDDKRLRKRLPIWGKILIGVGVLLLVLLLFAGGYSIYLLNSVNRKEDNLGAQEEKFDQDEESKNLEEVDPNDITWDHDLTKIKSVEGVYNILLIGEQREEGEKRGRTDTMMIATINTKENALKLTSLMRDTYVQIPGYKDNRLNTAFRTGGIDLLYETIELNYKLKLDGYIKVDYDAFENIIDLLGGVKITLTKQEADYLNTTNYISKKQYRNVKAGTQILNGNQALGYSRVRKVPTSENLRYDFGRTARQRNVLNAIFDAYKSKSLTDILGLADDMLGLMTTDISNLELLGYAKTAMSLGVADINTITIPIADSYSQKSIRGMAVLVIDFAKNREALHDFIYGEEAQ